MTPISVPIIPPQPSAVTYGTDELALFKRYTRASYREAFSIDPDSYDPAFPVKSWFDSSVSPSGPDVTYNVFSVADGKIVPLKMTAKEASSINLAGLHSYPAYVIEPTRAFRGGIGNSIDAARLSTREQAEAMAVELGLTSSAISDGDYGGLFATQYPPEEKRREWMITFHGHAIPAGELLKEKYANGIGTPGKWDLVSGPEPNWISAVPTFHGDDPRPPVPVPLRDLLSTEKIDQGLFGVRILRTDSQVGSGPASGGGLTGEQDSILRRIDSSVASLKAWFRIP